MYISVQLINWGSDHSNLNFHSFGPKFSIHFWHSWHLRKKNILFQGLDDLPETVKRFFTWPLCSFRERTTNKVPIIRSFTFIPIVLTNFAFLWVSLNSFILKSYSLVRINFNYSKVVFHQLCIILSHVNFQYLNFMEHWFPIIRYTLLIIFLLHLFSFAILFPCHLEGQDTSLLIFPVKYVKHRTVQCLMLQVNYYI